MTDINLSNQKVMIISGKHNKYMINKFTQKITNNQQRKSLSGLNLDEEWYETKFQINKLYEDNVILKKQITTKLNSYRQQDTLKKRYNKDFFIDYDYVKKMLTDSCMHCHYCNEDMYILYEKCRDMQQWSLDRIDNSIGHNTGNVVVSCLKCNLQRKSRDSNKFLQTKTMVITREDYDKK